MRNWSSARAIALAFAFLALSGAGSAATAQGSGNIQGTVTDSATGRALAGAQVSVVGSSRTTVTDDAGRYALRGVLTGNAVVRVARLGFGIMERRVPVSANETATADFALRPVAAVMSEVVVTGYGTASRAEVSSAVAQVSGDAIRNNPVAGIDAALQGKAPGVQVTQNAGNPGNGITVRVRGAASLSASNQPLYVVDGIPILKEDQSQIGFGGQDLTAVTGLSPDEIESIDVLKDAAAGAIYGSRASNGVVQITTKRGRPGKTRLSFSTYYGSQKSAKKLDLMNAKEYVEYMNEAALNDGYTVADLQFVPGVDDVIDTDWQALVSRTAPVTDYSMSVGGGTERLSYLLSGSSFKQYGIIIGSDYGRSNGRLNVDFAATDRMSFRTSLGVAREQWMRTVNDNTIEGAAANAMALQPNKPARRADGSYTDNSQEGLEYANPLALALEGRAPASAFRVLGSVDAMYDFTPRLRLTGRVGTDVNAFRERQWDSPLSPDTYAAGVNGVATQATNTTWRFLNEAFVTFDALRTDQQTLLLTAGGGAEFNNTERTYVRGEGFGSNFTQFPGSAGRIVEGDGNGTAYNLVSTFGRANYSLRERYLFTASMRADGSSRFGKNNRYGFFPSASFGWKATDESFLSSIRRVGDLKLRASWGMTGNQGISSNFAYLGTFSKANFAGDPGVAPGNFQNPDLRWETTKEYDVGFDLSFLSGRVALIGDYYNKATEDLLVLRPVSSTSGYTSVWDNVGNIENTGYEFQITATPFAARAPGGFEWTADFNISHNDNKVTKLHRGEPFTSGIRSVNYVAEGVPLGAYYVLKFTGVDPATGDAQFQDINGDGVTNADDRQIVGSPHPDFWGGLRNGFQLKGFDVNTFLEFSQGFEVFNLVRLFANDGGYYNDNKFALALKRWRQPGDITDEPRASWDGTSGAREVSSRFVEDGSYFRLQEVTLGYTLPSRVASKVRMANARIYASGRNLKLWTDYNGYDPDVNSNGSGSNTSLGNEFYAYPRARTISFGISGNW